MTLILVYTQFYWKGEDIFKRYSRYLNFCQIIVWVFDVKKYFQNAMSMIFDFKLNLIFWVPNRINLVYVTRNFIDQTCIKHWNFLKEHMFYNFKKYFSGTQVNQRVNKLLIVWSLEFAWKCLKNFYLMRK